MSAILPIVADCCDECCSTASIDCPSNGGNTTLVDTTALLRVETFSADKTVWLLGDLVKGDGGGGIYYFDATSMAADNPTSVVRPNAIAVGLPGRWIKHI